MTYTLSFYHKVPTYSIKYKSKLHKIFKFNGLLDKNMIWERVVVTSDLSIDEANKFVLELKKIDKTIIMVQYEEGDYPTSFIETDGSVTTRPSSYVTFKDGTFNMAGYIIKDKDDNSQVEVEKASTNYILNQQKVKIDE